MPGATVAASPAAGFTRADLTTFCRPGEPGLEVTGRARTRPCRARVPGPRTRPVVSPLRLRGPRARHRDPAARPRTARLAPRHVGGHDPSLPVCRVFHVWRQDTTLAAGPRAKFRVAGSGGRWRRSWSGTCTVARIAEGLSVAGNTASNAVLAEGKRALIDDTTRFDGVTAIGRRTRVAPHQTRRHVRDRDHRPHRDPRRHRPSTAARHGPGPLQAGVQDLAEPAAEGLARRYRGRRDGRVHRLQDRYHRRTAERGPRDGPVPCGPLGRRRPGSVPATDTSRSSTATEAARTTPSTGPGGPCTPVPGLLTDKQKDRLLALFAADEHVQSRRPGPSTSR